METLTTSSAHHHHHPFFLKFSRLFPSSCHLSNDDVVSHPSSFSSTHGAHRNPPPLPKRGNFFTQTNTRVSNFNPTSSSYTACFTSPDHHLDSRTFFTFSDNSFITDDAPLKFNQTGSSRSFSSVNSTAGKPPGKIKPGKLHYQQPIISSSDDKVSTQIYYGDLNNKLQQQRRRVRRRRRRRRRSQENKISSERTNSCSSMMMTMMMMEEGYAVEKKSADPREDFRASMVEMIMEKKMFGKEDLERLLICFLALNTTSYHALIVDVFTDICHTLFSN